MTRAARPLDVDLDPRGAPGDEPVPAAQTARGSGSTLPMSGEIEAFAITPRVEAPPGGDVRLAERVVEMARMGGLASPRTMQRTVGPSQLGTDCDRQLAYALSEVDPVNVATDTMPADVGTGLHAVLESRVAGYARGSTRFLIETPVEYRGVPGKCDLFDRMYHEVIDYKSTGLDRIKRYRTGAASPQARYRTQIQVYGAGMEALGETVERVALVFLARDGTWADTWAVSWPYDRAVADAAIDKAEAMRGRAPSTVRPFPSPLCRWCAWWAPHAATTDDFRCTGS